jgi:hypothetical protein
MTITPPLPVLLAYFAAAIFTVASASLNCAYGWSKGGGLPSSAIWASVAVAASIVLALSFPALLGSIERRKWPHAFLSLCALLVTGGYSVSAALGSASGGRNDASNFEQAATGARARVQAAYDEARAELASLAPTRPVEELEALLARENRRAGGCGVENGTGRWRCPMSRQTVALQAELGRTKRRLELEQRVSSANEDLSTAPVARQANSDAAALASFASTVGWSISVDAFNKLLTLLSVLLVECGGGLAVSVGMALQVRREATSALVPARVAPALAPSCPVVPLSEPAGAGDRGGGGDRAASPPPEATDGARDAAPTRGPRAPTSELGEPVISGEGPAAERFFSYMRASGGRAVIGQRALGEKLGVSRSRVCQMLRTHEAAGRISVRAGARGSEIRLLN